MANTPDREYTITKVSWLSRRDGLSIPREFFIRRFWILVDFLQRNNLTTHLIAKSEAEVDDESELRSVDLTKDGLAFVRAAYDRYSDSCKPPKLDGISDRILERVLKETRTK